MLGFEFDRLNSEVIALRTLPRYIHQSVARETALLLTHYFSLSKTQKYDENEFEEFVKTFDEAEINSQFVKTIIGEVERHQPDLFVHLNEDNLWSIFK